MADNERPEPRRAPTARTLADEIDALSARIDKESKSPKKRYAIRFLRYAKGNL